MVAHCVGNPDTRLRPASRHITFHHETKSYYRAFDNAGGWWHTVIGSSHTPSGGTALLADHEETSEGKRLMSLASHLAELQKRHSEIEERIDEALASPCLLYTSRCV